ncbi:MAG: radical SAM protein [Lachnospiraceae bacterium]|nr:radical SAM protein [Lachnospiraceae bacterium]
MNLSSCTVCPRRCGVNRLAGEAGYCGVAGEDVYLARAALHFYEEPCISGQRGSGAVFFSGCSLRCVYCQNREIARMKTGMPVSVQRLSDIFLEMQERGAHNLNLVTPTHYSPQILEALDRAKARGFGLPVVYNCGGYESVRTLQALRGAVDVYLTDFKYMDPVIAGRFSGAPDYPEVAKEALREMVSQRPALVYDRDGLLKSGVVVRHLLLPGHVKQSKAVIRYVYGTYGDAVLLSIMNQFTPVYRQERFPELNRKVTKREYERLVRFALEEGVSNALVQEGETQKESFIPAFDYEGVEPQA